MKKYECPMLEYIRAEDNDIITSSPGTEMPTYPETGELWDLDLNIN